MEQSENLFNIFDSKLKKYSTNSVAKMFARFDRYYFKHSDNDKPLTRRFGRGVFSYELIVKPWLFPEVIFYSTKYNDYKQDIDENHAWEIYGLYQNYDINLKNEFTKSNYSDPKKNIIPEITYGHMQEQGLYQISQLVFMNRLNREFHMLKDVEIANSSFRKIVDDFYGISLEEFVEYLVVLSMSAISRIDVSCDDILQAIDNKEAFYRVLDSLSIDYSECREENYNKINKDIFKIKPILKTQQNEYIVPSVHLLFYHIGDKLYWLAKDKYKPSSTFVDKFGEIFENYVYEILVKQYGNESVKRLQLIENKKTADFLIDTSDYKILIEVKAGVARVNAKKSTLNEKDFDFFVTNNIVDAMKQLDSSSGEINCDKKIIPMIVNYDQIFVEDALLFDINSLYSPKNYSIDKLLLFEIDYFENFIYKYSTIEKLNQYFKANENNLKTHNLTDNCEIQKSYFYNDVFDDYIDKFVDRLKKVQEENKNRDN